LKAHDPLPDPDHVVRLVDYKRQERDPHTDAFRGIFPAAFELRDIDKGALSVTWVEYFKSQDDPVRAAIEAICSAMKKSQEDSVFAIGQVAAIKSASETSGHSVRVIYAPTGNNKAHSSIRQFSNEDLELLDHWASEIFSDIRNRDGNPALTS